MRFFIALAIVTGISSVAQSQGAGGVPHTFAFHGTLTTTAGVAVTTVDQIKFQIINPAGNCVLYEETQSAITATEGKVSLNVGSAVGDAKRTAGFTHPMSDILRNGSTALTGLPSGTCSGGSYTPGGNDNRLLRVSITVGGVTDVMTPDQVIGASAFAHYAKDAGSVGGVAATSILRIDAANGTAGNISLPALSSSTTRELRFAEGSMNGSNYVAMKAPASLSSDLTFILPASYGSNTQVLTTDGAGVLSWTTASGGGSLVGDVNGPVGANSVTKIQGYNVSSSSPGAGQYLAWNGSQWMPTSPSGGGISSLNGSTTSTQNFAPIDTGIGPTSPAWSSSAGTHTLQIPMAQDSGVQAGLIAHTTYQIFSQKMDRTGDAMSGALNMSTNKITSLGTPTAADDAATKDYVDARISGLTAGRLVVATSATMISDSPMYYTSGKFGINIASPVSALHTKSPAVATPALTAEAFSGQTANIFEVRNSASLTKVAVDSTGSLLVGSATPLPIRAVTGGSFSASGLPTAPGTASFSTSAGGADSSDFVICSPPSGVLGSFLYSCKIDNANQLILTVTAAGSLTGTSINTTWKYIVIDSY